MMTQDIRTVANWPFRWRNRRAMIKQLAADLARQRGLGEDESMRAAELLLGLDLNELLVNTVEAGEIMKSSLTTVGDYQKAGRLTPALEARNVEGGRVATRLYWRCEVEYVAALRDVDPPGFSGPFEWEPEEADTDWPGT